MITTERIIAYFEENEELFNRCIEELDGHNGCLSNDRYYFMDELDELYFGQSATEILARAFYGHDAETWNTNAHGGKEYGPFNPNRNYFTFNAYGNLVSADYKDYSGFLDSCTVENMAENRCYIDSIEDDEELSALFDALEEESDDNGEEA